MRGADGSPPAASPSPRSHLWLNRTLVMAVSAALLLVYLATAARGPWWGDGLELAVASQVLGIPHPTGYPLFTVLNHVWIRLFGFAEPGMATTWLCAVQAAAGAGLLIAMFHRLLDRPISAWGGPACDCGMRNLMPAVGAGLAVGLVPTVWHHATITEVYALTFMLACGVYLLAMRAPMRPVGEAAAMGALMGLAALNHYSFLTLAPLAGLFVVRRMRRGSVSPMRVALAAGLPFAVLLLGYLYLPLRAAANPPLNWGDPATLDRLVWVLTGGQFRELKVAGGEADAVMGFGRWLAWCWGLPGGLPPQGVPAGRAMLGALLTLAALPGLVSLARRQWDVGWGLIGAMAVSALFGAVYHIPDIEAYFLPALPAAAVGWMLGAMALGARLTRGEPARSMRLARTLPILLALGLLLGHWGRMDKSWDNAPQVWGERALAVLPEDALILTGGDNDIYALWYQQMVLGQRPDVHVVGSQFIFSGWYARYFEAAGRGAIPVGIDDRRPGGKLAFDLALIGGTVLPNLAEGRRVFISFHDPLLWNFFAPRPASAAPLLPPAYYEQTAYPYGLPPMQVFELQPNAQLAALDTAGLRAALTRHIMERLEVRDRTYGQLYYEDFLKPQSNPR